MSVSFASGTQSGTAQQTQTERESLSEIELAACWFAAQQLRRQVNRESGPVNISRPDLASAACQPIYLNRARHLLQPRCRLQVVGCRMQVAGCRLPVVIVNLGLISVVGPPRPHNKAGCRQQSSMAPHESPWRRPLRLSGATRIEDRGSWMLANKADNARSRASEGSITRLVTLEETHSSVARKQLAVCGGCC